MYCLLSLAGINHPLGIGLRHSNRFYRWACKAMVDESNLTKARVFRRGEALTAA